MLYKFVLFLFYLHSSCAERRSCCFNFVCTSLCVAWKTEKLQIRNWYNFSWKNKLTNASVQTRQRKVCMLHSIWRRKHRWFGVCLVSEVLLRVIIGGRKNGKTYRGKTRLHYAKWHCIISAVSGSEKNSRRLKGLIGELQIEGECHKPSTLQNTKW